MKTCSHDKVDALRKRAEDIRAALEAVQSKQRQQERKDRQRLASEIGEAVLQDIEAAEPEERPKRRALISEVITRRAPELSASARSFLKVKGWL